MCPDEIGEKKVVKTPGTNKPVPPEKKKPEKPAPDPREVKAAKILEEAKKYAADHASDPVAVVKHLRALYFDVEQLELVSEGVTRRSKPTGGPGEAIRSARPTPQP